MQRLEKQVLSYLNASPKTFWELMFLCDASERQMVKLINRLQKQRVIEDKNFKIHLKKRKKCKLSKKQSFLCTSCKGKTVKLTPKFKSTYKKFLKLTKKFDPDSDEFLQGRIRPIDAISKAAFIHEHGDLEGNDFLLIGDDDFLSIATALTRLPKSTTVLEVDKKLVATINKLAKKHKLKIHAYVYDVRKPLPKKFRKKFDVFATEPPHTVESLKCFLSRGTQALRGNGSTAYFIHSKQESTPKKWKKIQRIVLGMGYAITDIIPRFCTYPDAQGEWESYYLVSPMLKSLKLKTTKPTLDWYTTALWRAELVEKPKPAITKSYNPGKKLYADEDTFSINPNLL